MTGRSYIAWIRRDKPASTENLRPSGNICRIIRMTFNSDAFAAHPSWVNKIIMEQAMILGILELGVRELSTRQYWAITAYTVEGKTLKPARLIFMHSQQEDDHVL